MPFTFSHPAIVLPFRLLSRQWVSLTGLVIGSLTPDFEYFLRMRLKSNYSHTISGLFWFDLPLGLILAFLFHNIVRDSLINNLPIVLKSRLAAFKQFDWNRHFKKNWMIVTTSLLIGAASHILWDSFTHKHEYFVLSIPTLTNTINFFGKQVLTYKVLQHLSSLLGALIIVLAIFKLPADKNVINQINIKYWSIFTGLTITIIAIRLLTGLSIKLYGHVIATGISAGLIALIVTSLLIKQTK